MTKATKPVTTERILQISNDIAEDMGNYTKAELVQAVLYWMNQNSKAVNAHNTFRDATIGKLAEVLNDALKRK